VWYAVKKFRILWFRRFFLRVGEVSIALLLQEQWVTILRYGKTF